MIKWLKIYISTALQCLRATRRLNLGDHVSYKGKRWLISNGVSRPSWALAEVGGDGYEEYVHQSKFRKERTLRNYMHDVRSTWDFYSGYWHDIWARDGRKPQAMPWR